MRRYRNRKDGDAVNERLQHWLLVGSFVALFDRESVLAVADLLRGDYKQSEYGKVILPFTVLRRLDCVLEKTKQAVLEEYKDWQPDSFIVEKKSNGAALYQEMRRMGVPLSEFTPGKGQDKISRVNAVSDLFAAGIVWVPDRRWAWEVVEECNDFPSGSHDDLVDAMTLALLRFRQGGFIGTANDEEDERLPRYRGGKGYY